MLLWNRPGGPLSRFPRFAQWRLLLAIALASGCHAFRPTTPVVGAPSAVSTLVGEWEGDYWSDGTGRRGTILFRFRPGSDTALAEVIMQPRALLRTGDADPRALPAVVSPASQVLTIRFVAVDDDEVRGDLDRYNDPECGCSLLTTFRGRIRGDVIEGDFRSVGREIFHTPTAGKWRVTKRRGG